MARKKKPSGKLDLKAVGELPGKIRYLPYECSCGGNGKPHDVYFPVRVKSVDFDGCSITATVAPCDPKDYECDIGLGLFKVCVTTLYDEERILKIREYQAFLAKIEAKLYDVVPRSSYSRSFTGKFTYSRDRKANFAAFMEDRNFVPQDEYDKIKEESSSFKSLGDTQMRDLTERFVVRKMTDGRHESLLSLAQSYENVCDSDD